MPASRVADAVVGQHDTTLAVDTGECEIDVRDSTRVDRDGRRPAGHVGDQFRRRSRGPSGGIGRRGNHRHRKTTDQRGSEAAEQVAGRSARSNAARHAGAQPACHRSRLPDHQPQQHERRQTEHGRIDEEPRVARLIDDETRQAHEELAGQGISGREERVLRGGVCRTRQAREVRDQGGARDAHREIVRTHHERKPREAGLGGPCQRHEHQVRSDHEQTAQHQRSHGPEPRHDDPSDQDAHDRSDQAEALCDGGNFLERVADVDVERVRHDAHREVREPVTRGKYEDEEPELRAVTREEVHERADHGAREPCPDVPQRRREVRVPLQPCDDALLLGDRRGRCARLGLGNEERRHDADAHHCRHRDIGRAEAVIRRDPERARARDHDRNPISELVRGGHHALHGLRRRLDAPRVDCDVLRRRGKRDEQREARERAQVSDRRRVRDVDEADRNADLGDEHPAAPAAEEVARARAAAAGRPPVPRRT
jgi:hypothetical protein